MSSINNRIYSARKTSYKIDNITFWNLHFFPNALNELEYLDLKQEFLSSEGLKLIKKNEFWIFYKQELTLFSTCIVLLLLRKTINTAWFTLITIMLSAFGAYVLFLFMADIKEYVEYSNKRDNYLLYLKDDILNSFNYSEFVARQSTRFPYLYK